MGVPLGDMCKSMAADIYLLGIRPCSIAAKTAVMVLCIFRDKRRTQMGLHAITQRTEGPEGAEGAHPKLTSEAEALCVP